MRPYTSKKPRVAAAIIIVAAVVLAAGIPAYLHYLHDARLSKLNTLSQQLQAARHQALIPALSPTQMQAAISNGTNSTNGIQYAIHRSDAYNTALTTKVRGISTASAQAAFDTGALKTYAQTLRTACSDLLTLITINKNIADYQLQVAIDSGDSQFAANTTGKERAILAQYQAQLTAKDQHSLQAYQAQLPKAQTVAANAIASVQNATAAAQD